jgi:hypothetical protein
MATANCPDDEAFGKDCSQKFEEIVTAELPATVTITHKAARRTRRGIPTILEINRSNIQLPTSMQLQRVTIQNMIQC